MATKKGTRTPAKTFNQSQAIRDVLSKNKNASNKEVLALIQKAHPGAKINEGSFSNAVSVSRKRLGLVKKKSGKVRVPKRAAVDNSIIAVVRAARELVRAAGGVDQAKAIIDELNGVPF